MNEQNLNSQNILNNVIIYLLAGAAFLLPLFLLPITQDWFELNKQLLFISVTLVGLVLWGVKLTLQREIRLIKTKIALPLFLLAFASLLSLIMNPSRTVSLVSLTTWVLVALPFLYQIYLNGVVKPQNIYLILGALLFSSTIISLLALYQQGIALNFFSKAAWLPAQALTPAGSIFNLNALQILTIVMAGSLTLLLKKKQLKLTLFAVTLVATVALLIQNPISNQQTTPLPSLKDSWTIATSEFKESPLFGTGPGKYSEAFQQYKPLEYNKTVNWAVIFGSAHNTPLQIFTELGTVGLLALVLLLIAAGFSLKEVLSGLINNNQPSPEQPTEYAAEPAVQSTKVRTAAEALQLVLTASLLASTLILILLPLTTTTLFLFVVTAALFDKHSFLLKNKPGQEVQLWVITLPVNQGNYEGGAPAWENLPKTNMTKVALGLILLLNVGAFYGLSRIYAAEVKFAQSLQAAREGSGTRTYTLQQQVIKLNPLEPKFHAAYATTNMAIANALAARTPEGLTEQDRQNISQLINQAIREARKTVTIAPNNAAYWEILGNTYRDLRGVAAGADQWAITSYTQAINLNPFNPRLRVAIGGIYYGLQDWDNAISAFSDAARLKNDYANAFYNLAWSYRQKGDLALAAQAMQRTKDLVDPTSESYLKAHAELEELVKLAGEQQVELSQQEQVPVETNILGEQVEASPAAELEPEEQAEEASEEEQKKATEEDGTTLEEADNLEADTRPEVLP